MNYIYLFSSILFAIISQVIMKWQVTLAGALPESLSGKFFFIVHLFLSPWVILGFVFTFLSGVAWMMTLTKFDISYAYPFTSLNFILMMFIGVYFFGDSINIMKIIGTLFVAIGIIIVARS